MLFISNDVGLDHLAKAGLSGSFTVEVLPSPPLPYQSLWKDILRHNTHIRSRVMIYVLGVTNRSYSEFSMQELTIPPFIVLRWISSRFGLQLGL